MDGAVTVRIEAYGRQKIEGKTTIAYINGDAPYVHIVTGSDAIRVVSGHCIYVAEDWAAIVNPFPRAIEICIAQGLPEAFGVENSGYTYQQLRVTNSFYYAFRDTAGAPAGKKFAVGMMMKRGEAQMVIHEYSANPYSKVMFFPGANADFMTFKPAGCMTETIDFIGSDGRLDKSFLSVGGYYTDADVAAWIAASGYGGNPITQRHGSFMATFMQYGVSDDVAVFYVREPDQGCNAFIRLVHAGLTLEDLD